MVFFGFRWPIHSVFNSWPGHSIPSPAPMPSAPPPPQLSASQGMAAPRERLKRPCGMDGWVKSPIVYGPITMFCWWNLPIWMVKSLFLGGFMSSLLLVKSGWLFSTPWFWGLIPNYMLAKSFTSSFVGSIPSRQNKWRHQCQFVGWKKNAEIGDGPSIHELFHILTWVCLKIDTPRIRGFIIISLLK